VGTFASHFAKVGSGHQRRKEERLTQQLLIREFVLKVANLEVLARLQ